MKTKKDNLKIKGVKKMKNIRTSKFYKELTSYKATAIAEGFCEGENATEQEQIIAWQYIYDKKLYLHLQGFFGRTCRDLLEQGIINE